MSADEVDVVDVTRDERWCQVLLATASAAMHVENGPFVGVVSADLGPQSGEFLSSLRPDLREIVCFDSVTEPIVSGQDFAIRMLERAGLGQDFVFTVAALEQAVDHAVDTLVKHDHGGWEGRSVIVLGPAPVLDRARRHLRSPDRDRPSRG